MTRFFLRFQTILRIYGERLSEFHPNARLYLGSVILTGAAIGVYRLLFNFFILSQGFDETLLGLLVTTSSMTSLLAALPMGYVSDMLSRRFALTLGGCMIVLSVIVMVLWPVLPVLIAMNVLVGLAQSLSGVTMGPFLMENSGEKERTYLFSLTSGIQMASAFVGNWLGGYLPTWIAGLKHISATSSTAYGSSLLIIAGVAAFGVLPLLFLRTPKAGTHRSLFAPFNFFREQPRLLTHLILPILVTGIGAGLIMPFMNVFFRNVYHQPDPVIGSMFAWGSLAMGMGMIVAPPLGDRYGKIQVVVFTQGLSIPFLVMMGFSPVFAFSAAAYFIRLALMNMSGPIYQTFVMEHVEPGARGTVASLVSMANSFGWAFSPIISGWLQVQSGFSLPFLGTILLYIVSVYLYWSYFLRNKDLQPKEAANPI